MIISYLDLCGGRGRSGGGVNVRQTFICEQTPLIVGRATWRISDVQQGWVSFISCQWQTHSLTHVPCYRVCLFQPPLLQRMSQRGKKIISDWNRRFVENSQKYSCQLKTNKPVFLKQHSHWSMIMTALWTAGRHQCLSIFPGADLNLNLK